MTDEKRPPLGVKLSSVYYIIFVILNLIYMIYVLLLRTKSPLAGLLTPGLGQIIIGQIILYMFIGLIIIFSAVLLWRGNPRARIALIIISILEIVFEISNIFAIPYSLGLLFPSLLGMFSIPIYAVIIWYLVFSKKAKEYLHSIK